MSGQSEVFGPVLKDGVVVKSASTVALEAAHAKISEVVRDLFA